MFEVLDGLRMIDKCYGFGAEHSQFEIIVKFIDCGRNALPLEDFVVLNYEIAKNITSPFPLSLDSYFL